ncbi:hypothetical protein LNQ49_04750 [Flavobacterium sp. F-65]|uniref:Uncharacterized protein n=1 Tax=Flavobacterium pisciphilum TaxID=2893755 RepID=A0ABS8MQ81_9FLAO|nr:hypothetical protein [Flavobacterium sp. F-65]MCC9070906.1 hypothetical protein [Flavobacterium sp. F-65]
MKNLNTLLSFAILVFCFLCIQISYNGTPSVSIFGCLVAIIFNALDNGWNFELTNWTMNFSFLVVEFIFVMFFLSISVLKKNYKLITFSLVLMIVLWSFWGITYNPYIEIKLYLLTSIPFLIVFILLLFLNLRKLISKY